MSTSKGSLFYTFCKVKLFAINEFLFLVKKLYFGSFRLFLAELSFFLFYIFKNPYKISKEFLKKRGELDLDLYGETPYSTWEKISKRIKISKEDHFLELGAGRGKISLMTAYLTGCKVSAIEYNPIFIKKAKKIARSYLPSHAISFIEADFLLGPLPLASIIYLYGSCLKVSEIQKLLKQFHSFPKGAKVITISYSLEEYGAKNFAICDQFEVTFAWGKTNCFVQQKID